MTVSRIRALLPLLALCACTDVPASFEGATTPRAVRDEAAETAPAARVPASPEDAYRRAVALLRSADGDEAGPEAVGLLDRAAAGGHADAQFLLALAYQTGYGVQTDERKAVGLLTRAAKQGHADAQYLLGLALYRGRGAAVDRRAAAYWFARASEAGHPGGAYHLAICYSAGIGVGRDLEKAAALLKRAAARGYPEAQFMLASAYTNARGVEQDHAWAALWYGKAAERGLARAQYMLGLSFGAGLGLPRDLDRAYFWLTLAARQGDHNARALARDLAGALGETRRTAIEARAAAWRAVGIPGQARPGADRPTVRFVQYALDRLGYAPGPVDGVMGPLTREALERYGLARGIASGTRLTETLARRLRSDFREHQAAVSPTAAY